MMFSETVSYYVNYLILSSHSLNYTALFFMYLYIQDGNIAPVNSNKKAC